MNNAGLSSEIVRGLYSRGTPIDTIAKTYGVSTHQVVQLLLNGNSSPKKQPIPPVSYPMGMQASRTVNLPIPVAGNNSLPPKTIVVPIPSAMPPIVAPAPATNAVRSTFPAAKEMPLTNADFACFSPRRPIGIRQEGNTCWLASALQMIINTPSLLQAVMKRKDLPVTQQFIRNYIREADSNDASPVAAKVVDVRHELSQISKGMLSDDGKIRQDASEALLFFIEEDESLNHPMNIVEVIPGLGDVETDRTDSLGLIELNFEEGKSPDFNTMLGNSLVSEANGSNYELRFKQIPNELFVHIVRTTSAGKKITTPIDDVPSPGVITFTGFSEVPEYTCDCFIQHQLTESGNHYISFVNSGNVWYKCDDGVVTKILNPEAIKEMHNSDLFHFIKK